MLVLKMSMCFVSDDQVSTPCNIWFQPTSNVHAIAVTEQLTQEAGPFITRVDMGPTEMSLPQGVWILAIL